MNTRCLGQNCCSCLLLRNSELIFHRASVSQWTSTAVWAAFLTNLMKRSDKMELTLGQIDFFNLTGFFKYCIPSPHWFFYQWLQSSCEDMPLSVWLEQFFWFCMSWLCFINFGWGVVICMIVSSSTILYSPFNNLGQNLYQEQYQE